MRLLDDVGMCFSFTISTVLYIFFSSSLSLSLFLFFALPLRFPSLIFSVDDDISEGHVDGDAVYV